MAQAAPTMTMFSDYTELLNNPLEFLDALNREDVVHYMPLYPEINGWLVTGYEEAKTVLTDPRFKRDSYKVNSIFAAHGRNFWDPEDHERTDRNMLNIDPPDHSRLRRLAVKPFTSTSLKLLAPRIRDITQALIASIPTNQSVDCIPALAYPLPMTVICEMLNIPEGKERDDFREWSNVLFSPKSVENIIAARKNIYNYLNNLIAQRRASEIDPQSSHLLDQLILARDEGEKLTDTELISTVSLLLIAGHETTVNLIGNLIIELAENKPLQQHLRDNPAAIPELVEEIMRNNGPVHMALVRYVEQDMELAGKQLHTDDLVVVSLLAANRDPRIFQQPEHVTLGRNEPKHLGFGHGPHVCLGAGLARLEAAIVVEELLNNFTDINLAVPVTELRWRISNVVRGKTEIPTIFTRSRINT